MNHMLLLFLVIYITCCQAGVDNEISVRMPHGHAIGVEDQHLCIAYPVFSPNVQYINKLLPDPRQRRASHLLLYGCRFPYLNEAGNQSMPWPCFEYSDPEPMDKLCGGREAAKVLFSWGSGEEIMHLPPGIGFAVGGDSDIQYLVLAVHYHAVDGHNQANLSTHASGMTAVLQEPQPKTAMSRAGVVTMIAKGVYPPDAVTKSEVACLVQEDVRLHPLLFKVHTHSLGTQVSGWKVDGKTGVWELMSRQDPQKPQSFLPVDPSAENMIIRKGDWIAVQCVMNNTLSHEVRDGETFVDEMCFAGLVYYVTDNQLMEGWGCQSSGPPKYSWSSDSKLPGVSPV